MPACIQCKTELGFGARICPACRALQPLAAHHGPVAAGTTIDLGGCAQFENSFGELWSPETQPSIAGASNADDSARPKDRSHLTDASEDGNTARANVPRSLMIGGVRIEVAQGVTIE